jgi:hypothetical protein
MEALGLRVVAIWGLVLTVVRLIESVCQLSQTPEAKTLLAKVIQVIKNFMLDLETYKKK